FLCRLLVVPLRPNVFPYTTLFRSRGVSAGARARLRPRREGARPAVTRAGAAVRAREAGGGTEGVCLRFRPRGRAPAPSVGSAGRSEEHTSELQSREKLVCRLLLEK